MSITSEIRLRVRKEGDVVLNQLSAKLNDVAQRSTLTSAKFKDLSSTLKQTDSQIRTKSINGLNDYARAWRELANSVDITSKEFREATREAQRFEQAAAKAQGRRGGGRAMAAAKGVGAVAASGIFGGPEGAIGALVGLPFGAAGAAVGGAIGAQVGQIRQQLGGTATYAAEIAKQRLALQLVTKEAGEYQRALAFVDQTSRKFAIPQEVITRQFTKLTASVKGAGGSVADAEKAFLGVAAGIRGTGGSLQDLDSALTATSQVFSKGKVSAEELRQQIGERLPGAFTLFAESMGMTPQELDKALEKGQVSLQDFQGFAEKLFKDYGEAAKIIASGPEAAGDRLQTALSRLSESVGNLLRPIGAAFQTEFAKIVIAIDKAARKLADFLGLGKGRAGEIAKLEKDLAATDARLQAFAQLRVKRGGFLGDVEYAQEQTLSQRRIQMAAQLGGLKAAEKAASEIKVDKPKGLPDIDPSAKTGAKTKKIQDVSQKIYDLELKKNKAMKNGNALRVAQLEFEISRQKSAEQLQAKQITQRVYDIQLQEAGVKLSTKAEKIQAAINQKLEKQTQFRISVEQKIQDALFAGQKLNEEELKRIQINRTLASVIEEAMKAGVENMQELLDLINRLRNAMEGSGDEKKSFKDAFKDGIESMGNLAENLGSSLANAFGGASDALADFISTGTANFKEFARSVLQDLTRIFMRYAMFQAVKGIFNLDFSANGNVMTKNGPMPLRKYAMGGIARSPQISVFGEGSTPEAYVPLPDGRSIPVTMKGGGDGGNVVVNVDAKGTSVQGDQPNSAALGRAIGAAVQAELIKQKRPGGLLA
jgi:lambda family phage tail tape measure protein